MAEPLSFQEVIMRLHQYWSAQNCVLWQPYNIQVGAGTMNPATFLRVLGPEPWNVAYVEPSVRPDDGRYGENPNRMQYFYQYQVILKPDPGNSQELYLQSLEALGIDRRQHDIRFVEDNWESPALGAWGLGWEVWLDGQEITQFTYFQQAGGQKLSPVSVEITYGLERILLPLQDKDAVWDIRWTDGVEYRDVLLQSEIEHCRYYFEVADVEGLTRVYNTYENEAKRALAQEPPLVMPAHDYVLKCSHLFNVLDTRGAISVIERADYFRRMQGLAANVASAFVEQRAALEFPSLPANWEVDPETRMVSVSKPAAPNIDLGKFPTEPAPFLLEIGVEELPSDDLDTAIAQLRELIPQSFKKADLGFDSISVVGTPRRLVVLVEGLQPRQQDIEGDLIFGPPLKQGEKAAEGFAKKHNKEPKDLKTTEKDGGEYFTLLITYERRPTHEVLADLLPDIIASIRFDKSMRWNWSNVTFSRPIRWYVALYDGAVIPFEYAWVYSGRTTYGTRGAGSPEIELKNVAFYFKAMEDQGIIIDPQQRRAVVEEQINALARKARGNLLDDPDLLDQVTNLVEQPTAILGSFDQDYLELPTPVLITVMKKHQRYFAVVTPKGKLMPYFIAVRNGDDKFLDSVIAGNEHVIRARFADARFFYNSDIQNSLGAYVDRLDSLTFQERLGSYRDKVARLEGLTARLGGTLGLSDIELDTAIHAAKLAKADLATQMVVEMTSLQGIMGREYALRAGESPEVANAIAEHYQPRFSGDALPSSSVGIVLALADRLDSLIGLFSVGLEPTGSNDPFGLRRAALGLVQILIGHQIHLNLQQAINWAAMGYTRALGENAITEDDKQHVLDFIAGRLRVVLRETYAYDVVEAVLGEVAYDPYQAAVNAAQLTEWISRSDWEQTLDAYARCMRITRSHSEQYKIEPALFEEPAEKRLYLAYQTAAKSLSQHPDVNEFLTAFLPLVPAITTFFAPASEGGVLVMHQTKAIRENRLGLLQRIIALADGVADFSQLEGF